MLQLDFHLEAFKELCQTHPRAAEQLRLALIEYTISTAPHSQQQRLRGLQFQIDMQRRKSKSPLGANNVLSTMMFDSLVVLQEKLQALLLLLNGKNEATNEQLSRAPATILPFAKNSTKEQAEPLA